MKCVLIHIVLVFLCFNSFGELNTDSLIQKLPELSGEERAKTLNILSYALANTDSTKCLKYSNEAIAWGSENYNNAVWATALYNKAECYYDFEELDKSLENYVKSLKLFVEMKDSLNIGETLNCIGLIYYLKGDYNAAAEKMCHALEYFQGRNFKGNAAHVYSNLGMIDNLIGENLKAVENYLHAAHLNKEIGEVSSIAVNYNGVGVAYFNLAQYDSSKVYYTKALKLFRKLNNHKREAIALNNIANIYVNTGDSLSVALGYYQQAMSVFESLNDLRSKAFVLEGLGGIYREIGNFDKAIACFNESIQLIKEHHFGFYVQQLNYRDLSLTYERMGRTKDAFSAFKKYSSYKDSLLREERTNQVAELEKKYQTRQKEAEIGRLNASRKLDQLQIKRDEELRSFGFVAILLLMSVILIVSIAYMNKKRTNAILSQKNMKIEEQQLELEKMNASKNKFFSIIAHDLKNPFHTVMGYSYLIDKEYERFSDEERKKYAADIYKSANSIFRLLQNLLDWSQSQTGRLRYSPQVLDFCGIYEGIENLLKSIADQKKIDLMVDIPLGLKVYADPMMLETILRNLMNNAIKFTDEHGWVEIIVQTKDDDTVQVCVQDSGVGMGANELENLFRIDSKVKRKGTHQEDGSGLGLVICDEFVKRNGGKLWAESEPGKGSRFFFTIPGLSSY